MRSIQAQKLVSISGTITNGNQGTYTINFAINFNGFVYLTGSSNSFYVTTPTTTTSSSLTSTSSTGISTSATGSTLHSNLKLSLNRFFPSIYTFALTNVNISVPILQIDVPASIRAAKSGISCNFRTWNPSDNYFNLLIDSRSNALQCEFANQKIFINELAKTTPSMASIGFPLSNNQRANTSHNGTVYYVIFKSGTPTDSIKAS